MNKKQDRLSFILSELGKSAGVSIQTLATTAEVSDMTIRRDLEGLENKGLVTVIRGVAILNKNQDGSSIIKDYSLQDERHVMSDAKQAISKLAATLIEPDDAILVDTGTTTELLFSYIPSDASLTVVCYNLNTLLACRNIDHRDMIFPGGFFHRNTQMFESIEGAELISRICINKCFMSAAGISSNGAVSCIEQHELLYKQKAMKTSMTKILTADSSKFGKIRPCMFSNLSEFDIVVTDRNIGDEWLQLFKQLNIKYMLA